MEENVIRRKSNFIKAFIFLEKNIEYKMKQY